MSDQNQLLREALQAMLDCVYDEERDDATVKAVKLARTALTQPAQPAEGGEPLFILHCGQIDSSGEQDEWETEANGQQRVDAFCRQHPGQKVKLYTAPPAPEDGREVVAWQRRDRNIVTGEWSEWHEDDDIEEELDPEWAERRPLFTRPAPGVPEGWRNVIAGTLKTDPWDGARVADYNSGWNDCQRKTLRGLERLAAAQAKGADK